MVASVVNVVLQCTMYRRMADEKQRTEQQQQLSGSSLSNGDILTAEAHRDLALVIYLSCL